MRESAYQRQRRWARETSHSAAKVRPLRDAIRTLLKRELKLTMSTTSKGRVLTHISEGLRLHMNHGAHSERGVVVEWTTGFHGFTSSYDRQEKEAQELRPKIEAVLVARFGDRVVKMDRERLFVKLVEDYEV